MKPNLPAFLCLLFAPFITYSQPCATAEGDEITYGTNNVWIGYVYDNVNFTSYSGYVNEGSAANPDFDQNFGGDNVTYATNGCDINTNSFSVRYRLRKTFTNATYTFVVGGDDGYRLSIDGGVTWLIDRWLDQAYTTTSASVMLNGTYDLVLEFYENAGANRISFSVIQECSGTEDTNLYGSGNIWNGYIYTGTSFNSYKGMVNEGSSSSPNFDQSFGGNDVLYPTSVCSVRTENFSARYRLRKSFASGQYRFIVGGDDGYRLSLDGGSTWVIDNWTAHSYTTTTYTVNLSGAYDLVLEFFENGAHNRVSFELQTLLILPIQLISFTGNERMGISELKWITSGETNAQWFVVQRSSDGASFESIQHLPGNKGLALTAEISYSYKDVLPSPGIYYYRLKMIDELNNISFSPIIMVGEANTKDETKLFPTLMTDRALYLQAGSNLHKASYAIYDQNGRLVLKQIAGRVDKGQIISIFSGNQLLKKGVYILKLKDGNQDISQHRFIIPE